MLPRTFLTQLIPARIHEAVRRVEAMIWRPIDAAGLIIEQSESFREHRSVEELASMPFTPVPAQPFCWGPKYAQRWFRLRLPEQAGAQTRFLFWKDQAEATLYIDGQPHAGLDVAHLHCPLPVGAKEVLIESVCICTGIWLDERLPALAEEGSRFAAPRLAERDELAWAVFHDLRVLLDVIEAECAEYQPEATKAVTDPVRYSAPFWRASPLLRRLCARLERAIDIFDVAGLDALRTELARVYADFRTSGNELRAVLTGHAHIDLVWLWPESVGEFKTVHTWATQTRLLAAYPEFRFGFSQPAAYEGVQRRAPKLHARVQALIHSGQWEATGGAYVESDTQLPCGEALWRSVRLGQERFAALRGSPSRVFWLPDVFGYSGAMPQILREFGVTGFFTSKLSWSTVNRFPHTSFRWRGLDGSEVLAHVVLLHDYNEAVNVRNLREDALHHQQAAVHGEFLVPTGYGDGGGGPTEEMCERVRRLRNLAGAPATEWGGIEPFFDRLATVQEDLPIVAGELSLELHRGVFTTHGRLKAAFRALERALQAREAAHVVAGLGPIPVRDWERLIFAQFHDYVPGSSIWEVYARGIPELERLVADSLAAASAALSRPLAERGWFNPLPVPRSWIDGDACYRLPPMGGGPRTKLRREEVTTPRASGTRLQSDRVEAEFTADGGLTSLRIDGATVALVGEGHTLAAYADHPAKFEAWDVDRFALVNGTRATRVGEPVVESEGLEAAVTFFYQLGRSTVEIRYSVRPTEPVLRVRYNVDWQEPNTLLKAIVATDYRGREARFAAPFGSVLRGQWPGHTREEALWEVPASRWMAVLDDSQSEGLAVFTEAKYGFTVRDGVVGVTLLRSALVTEADLHPAIRETPDRPRHSDLGLHWIELALGRYAADAPAECQPGVLADVLYTPCVPMSGPIIASPFGPLEGAPSLLPTWCEPIAAGVFVLRLQETLGRRGQAVLPVSPGWEASVALAGGAVPETSARTWQSGRFTLSFRPYQIFSVAFRRVK